MKIKEFIKRVEELGYLVNEGHVDWQISRICKGQDLLVAIVNKNNLSRISTDFGGWWDIPNEEKSKLLDIIVEFAKTLIEDREEENKFYLRHKYLTYNGISDSKGYLNINLNNLNKVNALFIDNKTKYDDFQTEFTLKEIEEIKEKFDTDLSDFEMVEVEE